MNRKSMNRRSMNTRRTMRRGGSGKNAYEKNSGKREQPGHYAAWALNSGTRARTPSKGRPSKNKLNAAAKAMTPKK